MAEVGQMLGSVAEQMMNGEEVTVEGQKIPVKRTGRTKLRMVQFKLNGKMIEALEQNAEKPSRWGKLAREGHRVVQFIDAETHHYIAVAVDGKAREYLR